MRRIINHTLYGKNFTNESTFSLIDAGYWFLDAGIRRNFLCLFFVRYRASSNQHWSFASVLLRRGIKEVIKCEG